MQHNDTAKTPGTLYLIVGASGSGKDTIINASAKILGRIFVPLKYTTRKPRNGEKQGREYNFLSEDEFKQRKHFTKYGVYEAEYGVSTTLLEKLNQGFDVLLNISNRLTREIKEQYQNTLIIYVYVSMEELSYRLAGRNRENKKEINSRLTRAKENLKFIGNADFILNNSGPLHMSVKAFVDYMMNNRFEDAIQQGFV